MIRVAACLVAFRPIASAEKMPAAVLGVRRMPGGACTPLGSRVRGNDGVRGVRGLLAGAPLIRSGIEGGDGPRVRCAYPGYGVSPPGPSALPTVARRVASQWL